MTSCRVGEFARGGERGVVSAEAFLRRDPPFGACDCGDSAVAEVEQVSHGLVGAGGVCCGDGWDAFVDRLAGVDHDEAVAVVEERLELVVRFLGEHQQATVGGAVHDAFEERDFAVVLVQRRAEHDPHVLLVERLGDAGDDGREVARLDKGHSDPDEPGTPAGEPARAAVRDVVVLAHHALDVAAGLG